MALKTCSACGKQFEENRLLYSEVGLVCEACDAARSVPKPTLLSLPALLGLVAGLLPFFLHFTTSSTTSVNGVETSSVTHDYAALAGGAAAMIAGAIALLVATRRTDRKPARLAIAFAIDLLGVFQILRGLGVIG